MTVRTIEQQIESRSEAATPTIVVGIPAFNTERNIAKVVVNARRFCDRIVVCDDGSSDDTARIAKSLGCIVVRHSTNMGYGAAIRTLIETAYAQGADILVTIDGDGQHNPADISSIVEPILQGQADIVIGTRFSQNGEKTSIPRMRKAGIRSITWLVDELTSQRISDAQSGFRAYSRRALSLIRPGEQGMGASTEILLAAKDSDLKLLEVPVVIQYSSHSKSTLNPVFHFTDVVASTVKVASIRHPLLFFGIPGGVFLLISLGFGIWDLDLYSQQGRLIVNLTLISAGTAIIGTVLATTGLLIYVLSTVIRQHLTPVHEER